MIYSLICFELRVTAQYRSDRAVRVAYVGAPRSLGGEPAGARSHVVVHSRVTLFMSECARVRRRRGGAEPELAAMWRGDDAEGAEAVSRPVTPPPTPLADDVPASAGSPPLPDAPPPPPPSARGGRGALRSWRSPPASARRPPLAPGTPAPAATQELSPAGSYGAAENGVGGGGGDMSVSTPASESVARPFLDASGMNADARAAAACRPPPAAWTSPPPRARAGAAGEARGARRASPGARILGHLLAFGDAPTPDRSAGSSLAALQVRAWRHAFPYAPPMRIIRIRMRLQARIDAAARGAT